MRRLRFVTYLAPSIPLSFYEGVVAHIGERLGLPTTLTSVVEKSGPVLDDDPFARCEVDVGFLCACTYVWLQAHEVSSTELLGVAPIFTDPRAGGRPIYFADVVVNGRSEAKSLDDLRGSVWGYNDLTSLSGYHSVLERLGRSGEDRSFLGKAVQTGSHLLSVEKLVAGEIDVAAIDSNVLRLILGRDPGLADGLRVVESLGPYPIQPVVVRTGLPTQVRQDLAEIMAGMAADPQVRSRLLLPFEVDRIGGIQPEDYDVQDAPWALAPCAA